MAKEAKKAKDKLGPPIQVAPGFLADTRSPEVVQATAQPVAPESRRAVKVEIPLGDEAGRPRSIIENRRLTPAQTRTALRVMAGANLQHHNHLLGYLLDCVGKAQ